ncbi:hypothetical protein [Helicobacter trogontum]|uniref:Uncharacterized protein n=1 Tax=Helicobacter trogontum TaxID=50960 RepID=A0A4U8T6W5_9HELI|nr:hypothetical protein [Helicobacter trogontum]MDY5185378.1 hypothetical protein [Helicobacter trogontum]TLD95369.1 hypothetical protein LS80_009355 [Helicobacter trogontum]
MLVLPTTKDLIKQAKESGKSVRETKKLVQKNKELSKKVTSKLSKDELDNLPIATQDELRGFLESVEKKEYQNAPDVLKIATLNDELKSLLNHNNNANVFITKSTAGHISQNRKGQYNQALRMEEKLEIPQIINEAKTAYTGGGDGFVIPFADKINKDKMNLIVLNSDEKGNFLITTKKVKSILNAKSEEELKSDFESGKINIDEFMKNLKNNAKTHDIENYTISTTLREHYYNPLIAYNKNDKGFRVDFAISEYSEKILTRLEQFLQKDSKKLEKYEWCFSKLIKNIDNIYIPYFDSEMQSERKFYPNFIFWFKNRENGEYKIIFVDPKGLKIEINPRGKIKGFESIYKDKEFLYRDKKIRVYLFYYNKDIIKFYRFEKYKKSSVSNIMSNII